jgi:hypothetical protein
VRGRRGVTSHECLYQALPSQLAGRSFAPLRLNLIPGLMKCRDAEGQASDDVEEAIARSAASRPDETSPPQAAVGADTERPSAAPLVTPAVAAIGTQSLTELAPGLVRRAMAALVNVLLAPLAPQARDSMLSEISSGWRLPPPAPTQARAQQVGDTSGTTTATTSANGPQVPADTAVESLADRCAAVLLSSRRAQRQN